MAADPGLVATTQGLAPRIRAWRADIEHQRRLPPELVGAMHELKQFRLFIPAELGGLETDLLTAARVVEQVAIADGAAGWSLMIGSTYGLMAALLPRETADDKPWADGALYRVPMQALLDTSMAAVGFGIGRAAIDAFVELATVKTASAGSSKPVAERAMAQVNVARAEAALLSARGFLYDTAGGIWDDVLSGRAPDARQLAIARLARINAIAAAALAVDLVYEAGGGSSIYTSSPLERCLRDIRTASQHVSMATANYKIIGRVLLGLSPDRPAHRL